MSNGLFDLAMAEAKHLLECVIRATRLPPSFIDHNVVVSVNRDGYESFLSKVIFLKSCSGFPEEQLLATSSSNPVTLFLKKTVESINNNITRVDSSIELVELTNQEKKMFPYVLRQLFPDVIALKYIQKEDDSKQWLASIPSLSQNSVVSMGIDGQIRGFSLDGLAQKNMKVVAPEKDKEEGLFKSWYGAPPSSESIKMTSITVSFMISPKLFADLDRVRLITVLNKLVEPQREPCLAPVWSGRFV